MNVIVRDAAYADLERIYEWIAHDRPKVAASVVDRILESIDRLARFPHIGHKGQVPDTLEWVVPSLPYVVVYRVDTTQDELNVIAVFHGAQDR